MRTSIIKKITLIIIITAIWLTIWQGIYFMVDNPLFVESPLNVFLRLADLAAEIDFWETIAYSIINIMQGFIFGIIFGMLMAFISINEFFDSFFAPVKVIVRATPVASFIMLMWIWLERAYIPAFVSFLMVAPIIWGNVSTGIKSVTKEHKELAKVYKFSKIKKFKYIYLPTVLPYFATAVCTCSGLVWKAGIAAEVLCQPKGTIGAKLFEAKGYLEYIDVFAWTVVVVIISILLELAIKTILKKIEKRFKIAGLM